MEMLEKEPRLKIVELGCALNVAAVVELIVAVLVAVAAVVVTATVTAEGLKRCV